MLLGSYLIVITESECVGSYLGHPIYKVSSLKIFPCNHSLENSSAEQVSYCLNVYLSYMDGIWFQFCNCYMNFLTEKDGDWVFWAAKYCREDFWSVLLVWSQFNAEVSIFFHFRGIFPFLIVAGKQTDVLI